MTARPDRRWTHVIRPFDIPREWNVYRSYDFGYAKPFSVGWWAVDFDGRLYRILELYGCVPGEPDTGVRWTPEQIFEQIRTTEATHPYLRGDTADGGRAPVSAGADHTGGGGPGHLGRQPGREHL